MWYAVASGIMIAHSVGMMCSAIGIVTSTSSLPSATCTTPLPTAAPEPPLDPPGVRSGAQRLPVVGVVAP
jgi:hypothetical protein